MTGPMNHGAAVLFQQGAFPDRADDGIDDDIGLVRHGPAQPVFRTTRVQIDDDAMAGPTVSLPMIAALIARLAGDDPEKARSYGRLAAEIAAQRCQR